MTNKTPAELGFRWPAEWEPHEATWMSWPHADGISFPDAYEKVMPTFVEMVEVLATSELVRINVRDKAEENEVRGRFTRGVPEQVSFYHHVAKEPWCRDHGPIFLVHPTEKKPAIVDWGYNAWGGKYPPWEDDDKVPTLIGEKFQIPVFHPGIVMEGGSLEGNGQGTLLTTESCLLNPNRNPHLNREQIEKYLRDYLAVTQILWLGDGIVGDDTDGHVDDLTRFVGPKTVLTVLEEDPADANYQPLKENFERLQKMRLPNGSPLEVVTLPMPTRIDKEDLRLPASYANFYIANEVVLLPVFGEANDQKAEATLKRAFPSRRIVPINCRELIWGLGAFHCLTQQQPRV